MNNNSIGRATRLVFIPKKEGNLLVEVKEVTFNWHKGMSFQVRQRSLDSLHQKIKEQGIAQNPLEISSKSFNELGIKLSAFNLQGKIPNKNVSFTVETIFQSSKVFKNDPNSPYRDILTKTSREAKQDERLKDKTLRHFDYFGLIWDLEPKTAFYDWVYINVLENYNKHLAEQLSDFDAFTDIEFNHKKSINCQAYTVALYKALEWRGGLIEDFTNSKIPAEKRKENFLAIIKDFEKYDGKVMTDNSGNSQRDLWD
ncbi:hypothetical protein GVX76_08260 [[Haemophilus] felis]|nr:hypothetical protein [[Haemophilus] felis]